MKHLLRDLAPISDDAWQELEAESGRVIRNFLAARRLVDFSGPHGWEHSAVSLGRVAPIGTAPGPGIDARVREVQPLVELRTEFTVARSELEVVGRGGHDADWSSALDAAKNAAVAEDRAVFHGYPDGGISGITPASEHDPLPISDDYNEYPSTVARAVNSLQNAGIEGPYAIALGPRCYTGVIETTERGGYPVLEHIRLILGGPIVRAQAVDGAVVLSQRGGDFELTVGEDVSIGYLSHTDTDVRLYFEESFTFQVFEPLAAVPLVYA